MRSNPASLLSQRHTSPLLWRPPGSLPWFHWFPYVLAWGLHAVPVNPGRKRPAPRDYRVPVTSRGWTAVSLPRYLGAPRRGRGRWDPIGQRPDTPMHHCRLRGRHTPLASGDNGLPDPPAYRGDLRLPYTPRARRLRTRPVSVVARPHLLPPGLPLRAAPLPRPHALAAARAGFVADAEDVVRSAATASEEDGEAAAVRRFVALGEADGVVAAGPVRVFPQTHCSVSLSGRCSRSVKVARLKGGLVRARD